MNTIRKTTKAMVGLRITTRTRVWVAGLALFHILFTAKLNYDRDDYEKLFTAQSVERLTTLGWWSIGFLIPAVLLSVAAVTRWFIPWAAGLFFSIVVSGTWLILVVWAREDGALWTAGGVVLWAWFLFSNIMISTSGSQTIAKPSHVVVPEDAS